MKFILPYYITDSNFVSSTVAEADASLWVSGTNYSIGTLVMWKHRVYSATAASTNKQPDLNPDVWFDKGPTNRWAVFDSKVSSVTTFTNTATYVVTASNVDTLAFYNMSADSITATLRVAGSVVWTNTQSCFDTSGINNVYNYLFFAVRRKKRIVMLGLPPHVSAELTITLTATGSGSIGLIYLGNAIDTGRSQYNGSIGREDYSVINFTNAVSEISKGNNAPKAEYAVELAVDMADYIHDILTDYLTVPMIWMITDDYSRHILYAIHGEFTIGDSYHGIVTCNYTLKGLV